MTTAEKKANQSGHGPISDINRLLNYCQPGARALVRCDTTSQIPLTKNVYGLFKLKTTRLDLLRIFHYDFHEKSQHDFFNKRNPF